MDCLRNHGPRMKFRLGHAKVNNPPRSEAVSRGTRRRRRRRSNGSRAIPTSFLPVLEAVGRLACRRISACLPRGWRGKWSSSVRYGLVIPPRSLSLSLSLRTPLHFILFAIPFSPLFSPALASSSCPSLLFHFYIYIYI